MDISISLFYIKYIYNINILSKIKIKRQNYLVILKNIGDNSIIYYYKNFIKNL